MISCLELETVLQRRYTTILISLGCQQREAAEISDGGTWSSERPPNEVTSKMIDIKARSKRWPCKHHAAHQSEGQYETVSLFLISQGAC
jgi:hypothetical protein